MRSSVGTPAGGFQQDLRRLDVVDRVDREVRAPALPDAGLRRQVEHVRAIGQQRREIGIANRRFDEAEARLAAKAGEVPFLDGSRVVIGEAVEPDDVCAVGNAVARRGSIR